MAAPSEREVREHHQAELFFYQLHMDLPEDITLIAGDGKPGLAWRHPDSTGVMFVTESSHRGGLDVLVADVARALGVEGSMPAPSPVICAGPATVYEWAVPKGAGSIWMAIAEVPKDEPSLSYHALVVMGGAPGSPYAADGVAARAVRDSLRIRSITDPDLEVGPGSCGTNEGI